MAKIKGVTKDLLAKFRLSSVVPTQRYFEDPNFKPLIAEEWTALEPINTDFGLWHWVVATHDGEEFRFQTHRNKVLNPDNPIKIFRFECKEDFVATGNGKKVLKGTEKFLAKQG